MATHETANRTMTTTLSIDRAGHILAVDDAFTGLTGLPAAVRGQHVRGLFGEVDRERLPADFGQLVAGGVAVPLPGIRLDLTPSLHRHFLVDLLPPIDTVAAPRLALRLRAIPGDCGGSGGDPGHTHGREANARTPLHTAILDQVQAAILATDPLGSVIVWNCHAERLFGWSREETIGQSIANVTVGPQDADVAAEIMRQLAAGMARAAGCASATPRCSTTAASLSRSSASPSTSRHRRRSRSNCSIARSTTR